ncbi:FAD-binding oxidoreductase [Polyangium spumosum]|uniref:FAD-binding protein n=1 Tax=Polyangium spumosum TaxID=889282 RepID=A0A6N7Q748_9BACT|nr:FAD-binding oxidoreductase [Polyangium spumosum]MRG96711.1 FAD-binding protein [Polyangium spumosum]
MRSRSSRRQFLQMAGASGAALAAGLEPGAAGAVQGERLTGRVVVPGDLGYEDARESYNGRFSRHPLAIVFCQNVNDVVNAIRWARARGVPVRPRSGRHCYEAYSTADDALVIDVSDMRTVRVAEDRRTAVIEAGASLLHVYDSLGEVGVTLPAGSCPTVGVAGLTLGGGHGALVRTLGLLCDSLRAVEMVTAAGEVIFADETHEPDLLWASRGGGGGNFGIVTAFTFEVHPIPDVTVFDLSWRKGDLAQVLTAWQDFAPYADDRLTCGLSLLGSGRVRCGGQLVGGGADELRALLDPLLSAAAPTSLSIRRMPYMQAIGEFAELGGDADAWTSPVRQTQRKFKNTSAYAYEPFGSDAIATMIAELERAPSPRCLVHLNAYGGAVARIAPDATAFPHREALCSMQYQSYWEDPRDEARFIAWVDHFRRAMLPYTRGAYVNYIDILVEDWPTAYYGANLPRLAAIKAKYDPDGVFSFPQSIPPPSAREP